MSGAAMIIAAIWPGSVQAMVTDVAENAVKQILRDPSSAQFRSVREYAGPVCGEVNAKNGFGGFTGYTRFIVVGSTKSPDAYIEGQTQFDFPSAWQMACH